MKAVKVAINAQINPDTAGGVESSATSIMRYYRDNSDHVVMTVLGLSAYAERYRDIIGEKHRVSVWEHQQERQITPGHHHPLWQRLARISGPARPILDAASLSIKQSLFNRVLGTAGRNNSILRGQGIEVVHFPYGSTFPTSLPFVFEPHDIQHRHYPEFFDAGQVAWRDRVYGDGCRKAAIVVCGSRWTKKDIMSQFGVPSERIAVVPRSSYNARVSVSRERSRTILKELKLPDRFAYYPAMTFPHKNHIRLFEALAKLRDEHGIVVPLVMTGRSYKPHQPLILKNIKHLRLQDQVHLLGVVPDDVLNVLFRSATFMVFPSLYEGLSQSLLEGLHVELPMVVAKQSSIPETVGPAGILFDGFSVFSIAEAIEKAWKEPKHLAAMAVKSREYYKRYSWERGGPMLTAIYRYIAGRKLSRIENDLLCESLGD